MIIERKLTAADRAPKVRAPDESGVIRFVFRVLETGRRYHVTQDRIHRADGFF
ncbi:hypothetical protein [Marinibacterium profundimaris]|uniref:hypothetical protein n=1 Tax=Marinibacterium profundimaris TaxID=1679460 RepID=UPI0013034584|nr:hypothetical protein [Marinibacterium profundimaris]